MRQAAFRPSARVDLGFLGPSERSSMQLMGSSLFAGAAADIRVFALVHCGSTAGESAQPLRFAMLLWASGL